MKRAIWILKGLVMAVMRPAEFIALMEQAEFWFDQTQLAFEDCQKSADDGDWQEFQRSRDRFNVAKARYVKETKLLRP